MSLKAQAVSGAKWSTVSTVVTTILQIVQYIVLARLLGPDQFGLMAMLTLVIGFSQIFADFGMSEAVIYRQEASAQVLSSLYWLNLIIAGSIMLLVIAATPLIVWTFQEPRLGGLVWMVALGILVSGAGKQFQVIAQKELRFRSLAVVEISAVSAGLVVAVALGLTLGGVLALVFGYLTTGICRSLCLIAVSWRSWRPRLHVAMRGLGNYLDFGVWNLLDQTVNFMSSRMDQLMIGAVLGAEALGYYNLAWYLVIMPTSRINPVVTRVAFPVFARVQDDIARLRAGYLQILRVLAYINFPILVGIAAVAGLFVPVAFGSGWSPAVPIVQILALVVVFRSVGNPTGALLMAVGRVKLAFQWTLLLAITQVPVIYVAARWFGLTGVALSLVAIQLVYLVPFFLIVIRPSIHATITGYFGSVFPALVASAVMGTTVYSLYLTILNEPTLVSLGLAVTAGVAIQVVLCLTLLRDQGRQILELIASR